MDMGPGKVPQCPCEDYGESRLNDTWLWGGNNIPREFSPISGCAQHSRQKSDRRQLDLRVNDN